MITSSNTDVRNELHEESLSIYDRFIKLGGKVKVDNFRVDAVKKIAAKKKPVKSKKDFLMLKGLSTIEKFKIVITHYKELNRRKLMDYTGLSPCTISRDTKILIADGFITRVCAGPMGSKVTFKLV